MGIHDMKGTADERGIGFPLIPIFFPTEVMPEGGAQPMEVFSMQQVISAGMWCLEHMSKVDPDIQYSRCLHTDGHRWKLYEVHRTHVKKTKFFSPDQDSRINNTSL